MATTPYFQWPHHSSTGGAPDSDVVAGCGLGAPEMALMAPAVTPADTALLVPQDHRAVPGRPRVRRSSSGSGKQQKAGGGGGAKKPPQRGLGVAELERLRCGGDQLRELAGVVDAGAAQVHPLMHCNHHGHHHHAPPAAAAAFDPPYCSSLLVQPPPASPAAPGCYVRHPAATLVPEQQYFRDRWGRLGPGFGLAGNGACPGGGDQHAQQLLPPLLAPEHPSSQSTIWRPAASSSSCLQAGHRCDLCARRVVRSYAERSATPLPSATPPSPSPTTLPDYSIYNLAAAMATARQGGSAFQLVRDRKRGALVDEAPAKKEVREIEFFPAASTHHDAGGGGGIDESELVPPVSSSHYGGASSCAATPPLDLSLRL